MIGQIDACARYWGTESVVDWLANRFETVEQCVFSYWENWAAVVRLVDQAEAGYVPRYVALSALREMNLATGQAVEYDEIRDREPPCILYPEGEWVLFTESAREISRCSHLGFQEAISSPTISWAVLWDPLRCMVLVLRSPNAGLRELVDPEKCVTDGMLPGDVPSFVLPPEMEATIIQDLDALHGHSGGPYYVSNDYALEAK